MCVIVISTDPKVVERTLNALLRIAKTMSRLWVILWHHFVQIFIVIIPENRFKCTCIQS